MGVANRPKCRLVWSHRGRVGEATLDAERTTVGRSRSCDLAFHDESLSRQHAQFEWLEAKGANAPTVLRVKDLGSTNGVLVNGRRVNEAPLSDGDRVRLGDVELRVQLDAPALEVAVVFDETPVAPVAATAAAAPAAAGSAAPPAPGREPELSIDGSLEIDATFAGGQTEPAAWIAKPLRKAAEALLAARDLDDVLRRFLRLVARDLGAERGFVGLRDPKSGRIEPRAAWAAGEWSREPITISRTLANQAVETRRAILVRDTASDDRFAEAESIRTMQIRSAMCAPLLHEGEVGGLIYVDTRGHAKPFTADSLQVLSVLATLAGVAVVETRLRESVAQEQQLRARLARYSSPAVVADILKAHDHELGMRCEEREITVLFTDFAGFTSFSEKLTPAEVSRSLNFAFEALCKAVFDEEGTLDKFTGDGMMVFFGAPSHQPDHAQRAVRAALRMQQVLTALASDPAAPLPLKLRIGVNTGMAIVGDVGTRERRDYTAIGDAVNLASRLEHGVASPGQVVVGPRTHELLNGAFRCSPLEPRPLKGISRPVQPWLVEGPAAS